MTTPSPAATPPADIHIDALLVGKLLREQFPDLADLTLTAAASGWDNVIYRIGEALCIRLPRRIVAAALIENEQRWLPTLAPHLPLAIPTPIRVGRANSNYPWSWSVVQWFAGTTADLQTPRVDQGVVLSDFLSALHVPAPADAPRNPYRGVPLQSRATVVKERMQRLERMTDVVTRSIRSNWERALAAPIDVDDSWLHGDLHARNVLVHDGRLTAIIDWGDLCAGDCATDLAAIWMLLPTPQARAAALDRYGASPATRQRALGWAILFGTALLDTGLVDHPAHAAMGRLALRRVAEDCDVLSPP